MTLKTKIVIYTPDPPEGYGAFDGWEEEFIDENDVIIEEDIENEEEIS